MKVKVSIALDDDVLNEIKLMAERSERSVSSIVNNILKGGLASRMQVLQELESVNVLDLVRRLKGSLKPEG